MGCHALLQGIFPTQGSNWLKSSALAGGFFTICATWKAYGISAAAIKSSVVSDSVQHNRRQSTRLSRPWDSPGKNTGVGFHFLLQCMKVKSESEVAQSCPTLATPWTVATRLLCPWIFQARILEWVAISFSRGSSLPRDLTQDSCTEG